MKRPITSHTVPRETFEAIANTYKKNVDLFASYIDQLFWWNERINLVSRGVSRETIVSHIHHSLLLTRFSVYQNANTIVDAGTGGGLPGLPLALVGTEKQLVLNDIVTKKVFAVKQMARQLGCSNVTTKDMSIAQLERSDPFLLISKHAFKINDLLRLTSDQPWSNMVLYKGLPFEDELDGIEQSLEISVYDLFENSQDDFYIDKALVIISQ